MTQEERDQLLQQEVLKLLQKVNLLLDKVIVLIDKENKK